MTESDDDMVVIYLVPVEYAGWSADDEIIDSFCLMDKTQVGSDCNRAIDHVFRIGDFEPADPDEHYIFAAVRRGDLPRLARHPEQICLMNVDEIPRS